MLYDFDSGLEQSRSGGDVVLWAPLATASIVAFLSAECGSPGLAQESRIPVAQQDLDKIFTLSCCLPAMTKPNWRVI